MAVKDEFAQQGRQHGKQQTLAHLHDMMKALQPGEEQRLPRRCAAGDAHPSDAPTAAADSSGSGHSSDDRFSPAGSPAREPAPQLPAAPHRQMLRPLTNLTTRTPSGALPLFCQRASPPSHSPTATSASAPAALCGGLSPADREEAAAMEVCSPAVAGRAGSPATSLVCVAPPHLSSLQPVDLSIRPLDVTPPAHRPAGDPAAFTFAAASLLPSGGSSSLPGIAPHHRSSAKAAWLQKMAPPSAARSASAGSAASDCSALEARTAAGLRDRAGQASSSGADTQAPLTAKAAAAAHRAAAIIKFRQKRAARSFDKKVRYASRKRLAESRPRVRGQFVKAGVATACRALAAQKGGDLGRALSGAAAGAAAVAAK